MRAVSDPSVQNAPFIQAWLSGTTSGGLRQHLIQVFEVNCPHVVAGFTSEEDKLQQIRSWLSCNDWLFVVEDATNECKALWECFPRGRGDGTGASSSGRLLITSQSPLHEVRTGRGWEWVLSI